MSGRVWAEAAALGALRGVARLPLEHPFERVKTQWQSDPSLRSWREACRAIRLQGGLRGFFDGALPNGARMALKEAYRWPLMVALPPLFARALSPAPPAPTHPAAPPAPPSAGAKALAGFALANIEALIICPLERLKVALMTRRTEGAAQQGGARLFGARELLQGLSAVYVRQVVSWVSFLWADAQAKRVARRLTGSRELGAPTLLTVAAAVGLLNTALVMPVDCVKTHMQAFASRPGRSMRGVAGDIWRAHGARGFYVGWRVRLVQYMLNASLSVPLLEYLESRK